MGPMLSDRIREIGGRSGRGLFQNRLQHFSEENKEILEKPR
jgi:hypothetical protein